MAIFAVSCASSKPHTINLMPAPDVYDYGYIDPFADNDPIDDIPYSGILYATDRLPGSEGDKKYLDERGGELRLGSGRIIAGKGDITWEEARRVSLLKNRTEDYPLKVTDIEEYGILDRSFSAFTPPERIPADPHEAAAHYADLINAQLAKSKNKNIYIYVHGYKVVFENPLLVATELWHFLGYDGVFIAYSWPSTPSTWAYFSDLETAVLSSLNLRLLIEYLAEETDAERIHIVGYSAGTRVVIGALSQLTFIHMDEEPSAIRSKTKLGQVILVGSDFDRHIFGAYIVEGMLNVTETLSVYKSDKDKALGFSRWLLGRNRLGQSIAGDLDPTVSDFLSKTPALRFIDVTDAEGATSGNGHAYFRKSPWASSDILMSLMYGLEPQERGLVLKPGIPVWTFPDDYIQRLRQALREIHSDKFKHQ